MIRCMDPGCDVVAGWHAGPRSNPDSVRAAFLGHWTFQRNRGNGHEGNAVGRMISTGEVVVIEPRRALVG